MGERWWRHGERENRGQGWGAGEFQGDEKGVIARLWQDDIYGRPQLIDKRMTSQSCWIIILFFVWRTKKTGAIGTTSLENAELVD